MPFTGLYAIYFRISTTPPEPARRRMAHLAANNPTPEITTALKCDRPWVLILTCYSFP
jgi:hypothetical protein